MDLKPCVIIVVIHGLVIAKAQLHLGKVQCYSCYSGNHFPSCVTQHARQCAHGEKCHFRYDAVHPQRTTIGCADRCDDPYQVVQQSCPYGGSFIQTRDRYFCSTCCTGDDCVAKVIKGLTDSLSHSQANNNNNSNNNYNIDPDRLFCPGHCYVSDIDYCVNNGKYCLKDEYCYLKVKHGSIYGYCESVNIEPACRVQMASTLCGPHSSDLLQTLITQAYIKDCVIDCCNDNDCLHTYFSQWPSRYNRSTTTTSSTTTSQGSNPISSVSPTPSSSQPTGPPGRSTTTPQTMLPSPSTQATTSPPPSSTSQTTPPASVPISNTTERLKADCKDLLVPGTCETLRQQTNVCRDPYSQTLCPENCGICQAIRDANCRDTVLNDGCKDLKTNGDICLDPLAIYTCAETCGICDDVIGDILQKFQNGQMTPPPNSQG